MPAFIFVSGYFAKYNPQKILRKLLLPYAAFQALYLLFDAYVLKEFAFHLHFAQPYWLMWYLMAMLIYYLVMPLLQTNKRDTAWMIITICFFLSMTAGFDGGANKILSFSRVLTFLPLFTGGYYAHKFGIKDWIKKHKAAAIIVSASLCLIFEVFFDLFEVSVGVMYGSSSYGGMSYYLAPRFLFIAGSFAWIILFLSSTPSKKIPFFTVVGQRTLQIYLLHGFIVKLLEKSAIFKEDNVSNLVFAVLTAFAITIVLAAIPFGKITGAVKNIAAPVLTKSIDK